MHLYVMRHGPAEDASATGRDADRPLSAGGRERVRRVAATLLQRRAAAPAPGRPIRVLSSPLLRARETADLAASILRAPEPELREELSVDAGIPLALAAELSALRDDALLVGHQPNVERLVRSLLGAARPRDLLAEGFCTAMVIALEPSRAAAAPGPSQIRWHLALHLDPRRLP